MIPTRTDNPYQIIGISGKAGTGKDYISQRYLRPLGYHQFSFAWHLKVWLVGRGEATYDEVFHAKPEHVRKLMQEEGTERGRNVYGEQVWVDTMDTWFRVLYENWGITKFVVPDVRFPNEVQGVQRLGGTVLRVVAPKRNAGHNMSKEARLHTSETALDNYEDFDGFLFNDPEYSETVPRQLSSLLDIDFVGADDPEDVEANIFERLLSWWAQ
jgi:hypothetical protein